MKALVDALRGGAKERVEGETSYMCVPIEAVRAAGSRFGVPDREAAALALDGGLVPLRYLKNMGTIGLEGQARLLRSNAVVIGTGGIGGLAAELLQRMGVGSLTLVDPDIFDETNLNRQNFACGDVMGMPKVEVVLDRLMEIDKDAQVTAHRVAADAGNLPGLLAGASVAVDALDNLDDRLVLQDACAAAGIVMAHGAIAGTSLQATTIYPGDVGLESFVPLSTDGEKTRGIEVETGNPATTPALAAVIQVQEAVRVMTGREAVLRGKLLFIDLEDWTVEFIVLSGS